MTCMRTCKRCGVIQDSSNFYKTQSECKTCISTRMRKYYKEHKQTVKDRVRSYYKGLRDDADAYRRLQAQWRKDDGE